MVPPPPLNGSAMGGVSIPGPPCGDPHCIPVHPAALGRLGTPGNYGGRRGLTRGGGGLTQGVSDPGRGDWGGVTATSRLTAFGCCKQKTKIKTPKREGKKNQKTQTTKNPQKTPNERQSKGVAGSSPPPVPPLCRTPPPHFAGAAERLLHIPVCWRRGCIGITNWKTFPRLGGGRENRLKNNN